VKSGLRLVPASEISPERDKLSRRIWRPIDDLLSRSLAIAADERFETTGQWLDGWNAAMAEIRQTARHRNRPSLASRMMDWLQERLAK